MTTIHQGKKNMKTGNKTQIALAFAFLTAIVAFVAHAQEAAGGAEAQSGQWNSLWDYWKVGGFCMYPIGLCSVAVVGLAIYCYLLYRPDKMTQPSLMRPLASALGRLEIEEAKTLCRTNPGILSNVLAAGLRRIQSADDIDIPAVEKAMEEASVEEVNAAMKPLGYLSVVTQVAPMFGLLGTVTGMIGAFNKIGIGQMGDPEKLASNIGEAMITTAAGLAVAIPAMFAYFGFKARYSSNVSRISSLLGELVHQLSVGMKRGPIGDVEEKAQE